MNVSVAQVTNRGTSNSQLRVLDVTVTGFHLYSTVCKVQVQAVLFCLS
jgi:hypothetical protein